MAGYCLRKTSSHRIAQSKEKVVLALLIHLPVTGVISTQSRFRVAGINGTTVTGINIRELGPDELDDAARLLGRGMCDNPVNVRSFGIPDAEHRRQALTRFFARSCAVCIGDA